MTGTLALVGGGEWTEACTFDAELLSGCDDVLVIPAAMAYERPEAAVERARAHLEPLGVRIDVLDVYRRAQAMEPEASAAVSAASSMRAGSRSTGTSTGASVACPSARVWSCAVKCDAAPKPGRPARSSPPSFWLLSF